jgi:hypothetical protein
VKPAPEDEHKESLSPASSPRADALQASEAGVEPKLQDRQPLVQGDSNSADPSLLIERSEEMREDDMHRGGLCSPAFAPPKPPGLPPPA